MGDRRTEDGRLEMGDRTPVFCHRRRETGDRKQKTGVGRREMVKEIRDERWETGDGGWEMGDGEASLTSYSKQLSLII